MRQHGMPSPLAYAALGTFISAGLSSAQNAVPVATKVASAAELRRAVLDGDEHILISDHVSISELGDEVAVLPLTALTKSIQVCVTAS